MPALDSFTLDLSQELEEQQPQEDESFGEFILDLSAPEDLEVPKSSKALTIDLGPDNEIGAFRRGLESEVSRLGSLGSLASFAAKDLVGLDTSVEASELTEARQRQSELAPKGLGEEVGRAALGGGLQAGETLAVAGPVGLVNPLAGVIVAMVLPTLQTILEEYGESRLVEGRSKGKSVTDAIVLGGAAGLLNTLGLKGLLEPGIGVARKIGTTALREGSTESAEEGFKMAYDFAAKSKDPGDVAKNLGLAFVGGAVGGTVVGGPLALQVKRGERNRTKAFVNGLEEGIKGGHIKLKPHEVGLLMKQLDDFKIEVKDPEFDTLVDGLQESIAAQTLELPSVSVVAPEPQVAVKPGVGAEIKVEPGVKVADTAIVEEDLGVETERTSVLPEELRPVLVEEVREAVTAEEIRSNILAEQRREVPAIPRILAQSLIPEVQSSVVPSVGVQEEVFGIESLDVGIEEFFGLDSPWGRKPKDPVMYGTVLTKKDTLSYSINPDGSLPRIHEAEASGPVDAARQAVGDIKAEVAGQIPGSHGGYFLMLNRSIDGPALPYAEAVRKIATSESPFKNQDLKVLAAAQAVKRGGPPEWVDIKPEVQGGVLRLSPEGELWAVKPVTDSVQAGREVLTGNLYRRGGILTPEVRLIGSDKIASRWVEGGVKVSKVGIEKANKDDLGKGFLVDTWLGVEDLSIGLLVHPSGRTVRTGFTSKAELDDIPIEHEVLRQTFEGLTEDDISLGLDALNTVSDAELKTLVNDEARWSKLVNRRRWLNSKYGKPELYGADGRQERISRGIFESSLSFVKPAFAGFRKRVNLERGKVEVLSPTKAPMHKAVKEFVQKGFMQLVPRAKILVSFDGAWGRTPMAEKVAEESSSIGSTISLDGRVYAVHLNTIGRSPAELYATLSHELGHILVKERLAGMSETHRATVMGGSGAKNFGEWTANEVSKWYVKEGTKPFGPAEKFFSGLARDLKGLGLEPPGSFIDSFVRDLYPGPRLSVTSPNIQKDAKKFGWFAKTVFNLHQNAKRNRGTPGFVEYTELNSMFNTESTEWYSRATERMKAWIGLGKKEAGRVRTLLDEVNKLDHWPTEVEFQALVSNSKVGPEGRGMYLSIRQDFEDALADVEVKMAEDIERSYTDPATKIEKLQLFKEQMEAYKARPYFPQSRFGEYIVIVKDGVTQKTIRVEAQESEREQKRAFEELGKKYKSPQYDLKMSKFTPPSYSTVGLPPGLVEHMTKVLALDPSQTQLLEDAAVRLSPSSGFKTRFLRRSGVEGYTQDSIRAYGDYFWRLGRGLSRIKYSKPMQEAIAKTLESAHGVGVDTTKAANVATYMNDHYKELMNPSDDWPKLRGAISTWIFGAVPRTGAVNLLQVPMVAYPHLAARFGDAKAAKALSGGYAALRATYTGKESAFADKRMLKLIELAHTRGIITESYAMELAGMSTEGVLQHGMLGFGYHQKMRQMQSALMFFMRESEHLNRRVVFRAAAGLALDNSSSKYVQEIVNDNKIQYGELIDKGMTPEEAGAFLTASDSVRSSMWEYAKYNRPKLFQGGKALPTQFLSYTQNLLWFMRYAPGRGRSLALHLIIGGLAAIPGIKLGAELLEKALSWEEPERLQLDKELGELMKDYTELPPDLVLHGLGFYGLGLGVIPGIPSVNLSPSLSMERVIPGLSAVARPQIDANAVIVEALGIGASITRDMFDVLGAGSPSDIRMSSLLLPPAMQNLRKAMDIATSGKALDNKGLPLATYDPAMPAAVARGMGFNLTEASETQEILSLQREQDEHIDARKGMLTSAWLEARKTGDNEMLAAALRAIAQFNNDVTSGRGIKGSDLKEAYRTFVKAKADRERLERRGQSAGTDREIREAFRPR